MPTRRKYRRKNRRKTKKQKRKHSCRCRSKCCGMKRGKKRIRCKLCIKKKCICVNRKKYRRSARKSRKYRQKGCARQRGGALSCNYNCKEASNMGEIHTGKSLNKYDIDLISKSTQNYIPGGGAKLQKGGGLSQTAINFGLGQGVSLFRSAQNSLSNLGRTWYGDHSIETSDVTVGSKRM